MTSGKITILYLDGKRSGLDSFSGKFGNQYSILAASSIEESIDILSSNEVHIVICDQQVNGKSGVQLLREIMKKFPDPTRIILSEEVVEEEILDAINNLHIFAYVTKPIEESEFSILLKSAFEKYEKIRERRALISKLQKTNDQLEFMLQQRTIS